MLPRSPYGKVRLLARSRPILLRTLVRSIALLNHSERTKWSLLVAARTSLALGDFAGVLLIGFVAGMLSSSIRGDEVFAFGPLLVETISEDALGLLFLAASVLFILKAVAAWLLVGRINRFLGAVESRLAHRVMQRIFHSSLDSVRGQSKGTIQFSVIQSVQVASSTILGASAVLLSEGAVLVAVVSALILANPLVALATMVYFLVSVLVYSATFHRRLSHTGERMAKQFVSTSDLALDVLSVVREARVMGILPSMLESLGSARALYAQDVSGQRTLLASPRFWSEISLYLGMGGFIIWASLSQNFGDTLGVGLLVLVAGARIAGAILPIQNSIAQLRNAIPQAKRALNLIENLPELGTSPFSNVALEPPGPLGVSISQLSFQFDDEANPLFDGLELEIRPGQFVALMGPSGAGKSTLVDLILGLNYPGKGSITIGGCSSLHLHNFRRGAIGYVPQRPGMVRGSIAENIALGLTRDEIDESKVFEAIEAAQINLGLVSRESIWRPIGEQADKISGGQALKIGLARALYFDPKFLVLDEPTSALDPESENDFRRAIRRVRQDCTVLMIAHKLENAKEADTAIFLVNGVIVAAGTLPQIQQKVPNFDQYIAR